MGASVKKRPSCYRCVRGGYELIEPTCTGRPQFRCTQCGRTWTCGDDGGKYMEALKANSK
jgi:transposase-like protein